MVVKDRFVFVHVPKTAGTTITLALGGKWRQAPVHTPLSIFDKGDRIAFGFVRNPWARAVSYYRFMCQKRFNAAENWDRAHVRAIGFKRWLMEPDERFWMTQDANWRAIFPGLAPMQTRLQTWWLDGVDFIGKTENLPEDFRRVCRMLDMTPPPLGHVNRTEGGDWRREYDDESIAFIAHHHAADIERFHYDFG